MEAETKKTIISTIYLPCDDQLETLKLDKIIYPEGDIDFNISIVDSYLCNKNPLSTRIKRAFKLLIGKEDIYYADIYVNKNKFESFIKQVINFLSEE